MKKIILLASFVIFIPMYIVAQVHFVDKNGTTIADGSSINICEWDDDGWGGVMMSTGLYVENDGEEDCYVGITYDLKQLPNGSFQMCFPVNCMSLSHIGTGKTPEGLLQVDEKKSLMAEWLPDYNGFGTCVVEFQVNIYTYNSITKKYNLDQYGPKVLVNMIYSQDGVALDIDANTIHYVDCTENNFEPTFLWNDIVLKSIYELGIETNVEDFEKEWSFDGGNNINQYDENHHLLAQPIGSISFVNTDEKKLVWSIGHDAIMDLLHQGKVDRQTGLSTVPFITYVKLEGIPDIWIKFTIPAGSICFATGSLGTNKISAYWFDLNSARTGSKEIHANVTVPNTQNDDCAFAYDMLSTFEGYKVETSVGMNFSTFDEMATTTFRFTTPATAKNNATFDADSNGHWIVIGASGNNYSLRVSTDGLSIETTSGIPIVKLMGDYNHIAEYQNNETALDILNYVGHTHLGSRETFTAFMEVVVESCYEMIVADNSQYFNVRFLRPVDLHPTPIEFTDEGSNSINVMDLAMLNDWRDQSFTSLNGITDRDGDPMDVNYITYDTPHYINYYGVEITADVENAYSDVTEYALTYTDAPITWNGKKLIGGTLTYVSKKASKAEFYIYIPITISYKWGTFQVLGQIKVSPPDFEIEDVTHYIDNAGFDEDLTFQIDGTTKPIISTNTSISDRSWAYIAADSSVYAKPKSTSSQTRPDGRKTDAVNGFIGQISGWKYMGNYPFPKCEWVYLGSIPYELANQSIPIGDDGSTYLEVPDRPTIANGNDNTAFVYLRSGWGERAVYKQTVTLPKAKYMLEYWAININPYATNGTNLSKVTCKGLTYNDENSLNDTQWTRHRIVFDAYGDTSIEIGFKSSGSSGSNPFLCIDGVKLSRIGEANHINSLEACKASITKGKQAALSLNLSNEDELIAFEFDLQLPDGITIAKDEDNDPIATLSSRCRDHSLGVSDQGNGLYHFLCYSNSNKVISGNEGELLTIELLCDGNIAVGTYQAMVKNIIFSDVDKNKITQSDYTFDLEVIEAVPGDVNNDGEINVMDVVEMVAYIMGDGSEGFVFAAADLYPDGAINVMDLVNLVELIMNSSASNAREWAEDGMSLSTLADGTVSVNVNNPEQYVASEFIVGVSAGQTLETVTADKHHRVTCSQLDDSHYKVMTYSSANSTFNSDALVQLHISGEGIVNVHDALLVDESRKGVAFAPAVGGYTTGINSTFIPLMGRENVYDLQGKKRDTSRPYKHEVLIVNGKKQVVR